MSLIEQAKIELDAIDFGEEDTQVMLAILATFFQQWDSGGAVSIAAPILSKLLAGAPLSPLTGIDTEWVHVGEQNGQPLYQNKRCGSVFKGVVRERGGPRIAYDIDAFPNLEPIEFPYTPVRTMPPSPVMEVRARSAKGLDE